MLIPAIAPALRSLSGSTGALDVAAKEVLIWDTVLVVEEGTRVARLLSLDVEVDSGVSNVLWLLEMLNVSLRNRVYSAPWIMIAR